MPDTFHALSNTQQEAEVENSEIWGTQSVTKFKVDMYGLKLQKVK